MAIRNPRRPMTAREREVADRVARARAANPPRDPTGAHHAAIAELASETGRDVVDLLDWWDEAAAVREYDGNVSRTDAERLAFDDVADHVRRQRRLA